ncbi:MAG: hypothetical protein ACJAYC_001171 [Halieaceae bacterium]|jgi:hypothetical protein
MTDPENKDQVVRIDGSGTTSAKVREAASLYLQRAGGGPEVSFAKSLRFYAEIGAEFERLRILGGNFPFSTEQALKLHAQKMAGGRESTHLEIK